MLKAKTVDGYIASAPGEARALLEELREAIRSAAPAAVERISYGMPYYDFKGRLAYFGLAKAHIGLYIPSPIVFEFKDELSAYETTNATIRLPLDKKLPLALIKRMIKARMKINMDNSIPSG
jgi:uncharacterized protein YdhG (YjbR/CyaY superfamily)